MFSCKNEEVPVLTTADITNITGTTATCGGTINDEGSGTIIERGVCWSTNNTPTIADNKTANGAGAGSFISNISGLSGATTYFVKAYARNEVGTGYGMAMSFTTLGQKPTVNANSVSNITANSAMLDGTINANFLSTVVTFEYGTSTSYGQSITATQSPVTGNINTNVNVIISGLTARTTFHFRIKAVNSLGITYSENITFSTYGSVTDADGNHYNTLIIDNREWMKENLKTTKYNDNSTIPLVTDRNAWQTGTPGYCWYNFDPATFKDIYGALYNFPAIDPSRNGGKNVCPIGWHVPSDAEWTTLTNYLIANGYNYDGTNFGNKIAKSMANATGWAASSNIGSVGNVDFAENRNITGFSAIPSGCRIYTGTFSYRELNCFWWSSTFYSGKSFSRGLEFDENFLIRNDSFIQNGFSVRCIKD